MTSPPLHVSAGALPWCVDSDGCPRVLLVHRRKPDDWAIAKGNVEPGEPAEACARRELREETGLRCRLSWTLPTLQYRTRSGEAKTTLYWATTPTTGQFRANKEVDAVRWCGLTEAVATLTKPRERAIPLALAAQLHTNLGVFDGRRPRPVLLVRGAAATPREQWPRSDTTRPLTSEGQQAACSLANLSSLFHIDQVLSAHARRCIDTVGPLANRQMLIPKVTASLAEDRVAQALDLVDRVRGTGTVLCTHEDVISALLQRLAARDAMSVNMTGGSRRGSVWVLTANQHRYTAAHYLPMPEILRGTAQQTPLATASRGAA